MFAPGACFRFPLVQWTVEESAVEPKMMIRASWMLGVEVEVAEEGRMLVLIVHSLEQVESCSFLEL